MCDFYTFVCLCERKNKAAGSSDVPALSLLLVYYLSISVTYTGLCDVHKNKPRR